MYGRGVCKEDTHFRLQDSAPEVQLDALDVLQEMLKKFGMHMTQDHEKIQKLLLTLLGSNRNIVRKRSITSIGYLTLTLNDKLLGDLIKVISTNIKGKGKTVRAYMLSIRDIAYVSNLHRAWACVYDF